MSSIDYWSWWRRPGGRPPTGRRTRSV